METTGWFDGKPAKIRRSGGTTEIFYGGAWGKTSLAMVTDT